MLTLHRRQPAAPPLNTSSGCCGTCWAAPGREHGLACPDAPQRHRPLAFPENARVFAGLLVGIPIGAALWVVGALIAWSLA